MAERTTSKSASARARTGARTGTTRTAKTKARPRARATPLSKVDLKEEQLKEIWYFMKLCRFFDERMETLYRQGKLPGAIYSGRGQEGTHVGTAYALRDEDKFLGTHRDLSAQLTKGLDLKRVAAQYWGRIDGYTRGRDGNSHIGDFHGAGTFAAVSMLPDSYPVTCGVGLAFKMRGEKRVAVGMCGEGATSNGRWHESLNFSAIHELPVVWLVNNNQWAYSTPNKLEFPIERISDRGPAYGMPGKHVDGSQVLEVYRTVSEAVERARAGDGPTLIESVSLRWKGHAGHDPAKYVPTEVLDDHTQNRDPVAKFEALLRKEGVVDDSDAKQLEERVKKEFDEAYEFAQQSPLPDAADAELGVFTDDGYWARPPEGALLKETR
ncbi:MAG TPA: thiamine pyrophosphate-dependent dehydrogenase E1 component subunit alpha [Actinomycetota bacterium]|nr:thiamine pyrophosphate-dependent dehydrogenase E1 component subunit alpha [Actinomycetota bacterium]